MSNSGNSDWSQSAPTHPTAAGPCRSGRRHHGGLRPQPVGQASIPTVCSPVSRKWERKRGWPPPPRRCLTEPHLQPLQQLQQEPRRSNETVRASLLVAHCADFPGPRSKTCPFPPDHSHRWTYGVCSVQSKWGHPEAAHLRGSLFTVPCNALIKSSRLPLVPPQLYALDRRLQGKCSRGPHSVITQSLAPSGGPAEKPAHSVSNRAHRGLPGSPISLNRTRSKAPGQRGMADHQIGQSLIGEDRRRQRLTGVSPG